MVALPPTEAASGSRSLSARAWWTAVLYIAAAAMVLRFYDLPLKPLHHDEGVNALLLTRLVEPPHRYAYDPANYHGPTLYYFGWLSAWMLGLTTVALRIVTATAGLVTVLLTLTLRRWVGDAGALFAGALLAVSPGAVYFSRYFIHETLLVCFTLATVAGVAAWSRRQRAVALLSAGIAAGLVFATKETVVISAAAVLAAAAGAAILVSARKHGWAKAAEDPLRWFRPAPRTAWIALAAGLALTVALLLYTSLFTRWDGASDAVQTFAFWARTGTSTHTNPWYAYLEWLAIEELPLLLAGGLGAMFAVWRRTDAFGVFASLWLLAVLAVYSAIPYKTPWLVLNAIVPLALTGGHLAEALWQRTRGTARTLAGLGAAIILATATAQSVVLNFAAYDDDRHPYVYVHTVRDALNLVEKIHQLEARNPGATIAVTSPQHFPLSWYLRGYRAGYYGKPVFTGDSIIVASVPQEQALVPALRGRYDKVGTYTLRPGVRLVLYVRSDLKR